MNDVRVVILTALDVEYESIRSKLADVHARQHPAGTQFEVGVLEDHRCSIALALVGKGNHPAAVLTERAIAEFAPAAVLFVGVAGALWPQIPLGDVVVATHVYAYHGGTSEHDGLKGRPRVWEISHRPDQIARHLARTDGWKRRLPHGGTAPEVHFGPIAAGEIVRDSAISSEALWIREHYNDLPTLSDAFLPCRAAIVPCGALLRRWCVPPSPRQSVPAGAAVQAGEPCCARLPARRGVVRRPGGRVRGQLATAWRYAAESVRLLAAAPELPVVAAAS